jgi:hypothetical protein
MAAAEREGSGDDDQARWSEAQQVSMGRWQRAVAEVAGPPKPDGMRWRLGR